MTWGEAELPRARLRARAVAAMGAVTVIAVIVGATSFGGDTVERDPEVLNIETADTDVALPSAPSAGGTTRPADPTPAGPTPPPQPDASPTPAVVTSTEGAPDIPTAQEVRLAMLVLTLPGTPGAISGDGVRLEVIDFAGGVRRSAGVRTEPLIIGGAQQLIARGDLLLVAGRGGITTFHPDLGARRITSQDTYGLYAAPGADTYWAVLGNGDVPFGRPLTVVASTDAGPRNSIELPAAATPVGAMSAGLLVATGDTVVLVAADGQTRTLSRGQFITATADRVVLLRCGSGLQCDVVVVDADGRELHAVRAPADLPGTQAFFGGMPRLSPDGTLLAYTSYSSSPGSSLVLFDVAEGVRMPTPPALDGMQGGGRWTPDSSALVTSSGNSLLWWDIETGETTVILAEGQVVDHLLLGPADA